MSEHPIMHESPGESRLSAEPPSMLVSPGSLYEQSRKGIESYLATIPSGRLRGLVTGGLRDQVFGSSNAAADYMEAISKTLWSYNDLYSFFGMSQNASQTPLQKTFNHKLCTHNPDGTLNTITSDDLAPLFPEGRESQWPHLVLTSNHARAWQHTDISEIMQGFKRVLVDAGLPEEKICRLTKNMEPKEAEGKTIIVAAVHSHKDPFLNGAELIRRRLELEARPEGADGLFGEREHMSPAAMRLAKLMFKLMCEPGSYPLVRLDAARIDENPGLKRHPYIAEFVGLVEKESTDFGRNEERPLILRADAAKVASHMRAMGYSKGSNTVTDALRFLYQEMKLAQAMTAIRQPARSLKPLEDEDIKSLISKISLLSIAPGEVAITDAERDIAGIRRSTIENRNDIVAGQYTHYNSRPGDRVLTLNGATENSGHSPLDALGNAGRGGFIMDASRAEGLTPSAMEYQAAQQVMREFVVPMLGRAAGRGRT